MSDGLPLKRPAPEVAIPEKVEGPAEKRERPIATPTEHPATEKPKPEGVPAALPSATPVRALKKSPLLQEIENVLEEGLLPTYKKLTPKQRMQFKIVGERTAGSIERVLKQTKVKLIELIRLIRRWLQLLPVNVFFLEQEAKIKAEKLLALKGKDDTQNRR
ncbi:MAG: hypothetical protein Q8P56_02765 [Candidatus Uhrbacteria bacterium]|nr:hypothetical protein [Candidatus Uhrbacteria bacterium]